MHQEINSPNISKVYACVFRPEKKPMRTVYNGVTKGGEGDGPPLAALLWGRRYGICCRL